MKGTRDIIGEIANFLGYLARNDNFSEERAEEKLKEKFGAKNFDNLLNICFFGSSSYVEREVIRKDEKIHHFNLRITSRGLKFLGDYGVGQRMEQNARATLFLTSILVLTAIAAFFNETNIPTTVF